MGDRAFHCLHLGCDWVVYTYVKKLLHYTICTSLSYCLCDFPGGSDGKEFACNAGDLGLIPWLGRSPGGGHDQPLQYSCLEHPHGQRSLTGYSPWGRKELDMTVQLSTALHTPSYFLRQGEAVPPHKKRTRSKGKGLGITSLHMPNL